ncbi:MAG: tryptophan--tRNA ligase [Gammaproteobacteria bacterium]|nr:tryptophan--tRNA ligase [Gammaproteobacteria bacterium]
MSSEESTRRVVSGMRPTGRMHLGHLHGCLFNWRELQLEYECYFFVADWHALTTHYERSGNIQRDTFDMIVDWLAVGLNPAQCTLFVQSRVPEHAELAVLLGMVTPVSWLERVPTYKQLREELTDFELATHGFLGYPVLQAADILMYRGGKVPVGQDQAAHVELTRQICRRFNHIYGREEGFEAHALAALKKMDRRAAKRYQDLMSDYQERGIAESLQDARALLIEQGGLSVGDRERLEGYIEGTGRIILPEPQVLLTESASLPGLDGRKMSKSYGNTILLGEAEDEIERKVRTMKTDPARVRRTDAGDPNKCPVFDLHRVYSDEACRNWAAEGCRTAAIGCIDCKKPLIDSVRQEQAPIREAAESYRANPDFVESVLREGSERAREEAKDTLEDVRSAIGLVGR